MVARMTGKQGRTWGVRKRKLAFEPMEARRVLAATFDIVIDPGPTLASNPDAVAAFERAAEQWESHFTDPITVTIAADFAPLPPGILGGANTLMLVGPYDVVRDLMVADAAEEVDDRIVKSLPTSSNVSFNVPTGVEAAPGLASSKAALKAMGVPGLDSVFGPIDGQIRFSTSFPFDFDDSDGVDSDKFSFETVAAHEIGHVLGFTSVVQVFDFLIENEISAAVEPATLDLFRFADDTPDDPNNHKQFASFPRNLVPGQAAVLDQTHAMAGSSAEMPMSTGTFNGDGRQASHFKDDLITGTNIGIMDPTGDFGQRYEVGRNDLRALDLIGYDYHVGNGKSGPGSKGLGHSKKLAKLPGPSASDTMIVDSAFSIDTFQLASNWREEASSSHSHQGSSDHEIALVAVISDTDVNSSSGRVYEDSFVHLVQPAKPVTDVHAIQTQSLPPSQVDRVFQHYKVPPTIRLTVNIIRNYPVPPTIWLTRNASFV